ncbi:MAG: family 1 encapsulin nanocompartment shell protein [Sulfolobales archaeon]
MVLTVLSKHPVEVLKERKLTKKELAEALRLSMVAELDAINLYLQIAERVEDERYRKVFEDIAKEEKTHFGEFLELLKTLDEEQVKEIVAGAREVEELTGLKAEGDPDKGDAQNISAEVLSEEEWTTLKKAFREVLDVARVYRRHLPVVSVGKGVPAIPLGTGTTTLVKLEEVSTKFKIALLDVEASRRLKTPVYLGPVQVAAYEIARKENEYITKSLVSSSGVKIELSDWGTPGNPVSDVTRAVAELLKAGVVPPFVLFVSPSRYAKLVAVHEKTGVMELTRVKAIVKEVVVVPELPDSVAIVVASNPSVLDLVVGAEAEIEFIGPEDGFYAYRAWETLAIRVKNSSGIAVLTESQRSY